VTWWVEVAGLAVAAVVLLVPFLAQRRGRRPLYPVEVLVALLAGVVAGIVLSDWLGWLPGGRQRGLFRPAHPARHPLDYLPLRMNSKSPQGPSV
jgi:hypothetical protein